MTFRCNFDKLIKWKIKRDSSRAVIREATQYKKVGSTVTEHLFKDSRGAHIQVTAWAEDMNHHPLQLRTYLSSEKCLQLPVGEEVMRTAEKETDLVKSTSRTANRNIEIYLINASNGEAH